MHGGNANRKKNPRTNDDKNIAEGMTKGSGKKTSFPCAGHPPSEFLLAPCAVKNASQQARVISCPTRLFWMHTKNSPIVVVVCLFCSSSKKYYMTKSKLEEA
jgi:hypothetical protein